MDQSKSAQLDTLIESVDNLKLNLENSANYAVMWLGETLDFLTNDDIKMAMWAYGQYMKALDQIDIEQYKKIAAVLNERITHMSEL